MATSKNFRGLQPSRMRGGAYNTSGMNEYGVKAAHATAIFQGDLVVPVAAGNIDGYSCRSFYGC